jgi:hypothetical protein
MSNCECVFALQLQWGIKSNNAWEDPAIPNYQQVNPMLQYTAVPDLLIQLRWGWKEGGGGTTFLAQSMTTAMSLCHIQFTSMLGPRGIQEIFDKRDNLQREKVSKRDKFPCYLT